MLHPDYLLPALSSRQLAEWQAYFKYQPFGQDMTQFMLARLTAFYLNAHKAKGSEDAKAEDLMPGFRRPQSVEEIKYHLRSRLAAVPIQPKK